MPDISEELLRRVEADEPDALWEYSRLMEHDNPGEAHKYAVLAAQLGVPQAIKRLGDEYYRANNLAEAEHYYRLGVKAGLIDCSVRLAEMRLPSDEQNAVTELEELAEMGVNSACAALADYYSKLGDKVQYAYWNSRVQE